MLIIGIIIPSTIIAQVGDVTVTVHLRGVFSSDISILGLTRAQTFKPILEKKDVKNGETAQFTITKENLPGEFVFRFDYKEKESSSSYPAEKYFFAFNQDLEFWVCPIYSNNSDSSYFQAGEMENSAFSRFSSENAKRREKLGLLQNFLMNYDDTGSDFYQEAINEYEKRRKEYNSWLEGKRKEDRALFVSNLYAFQYVPKIPFEGSETDRIYSLIDHYFDGTDFRDSLMTRSSDMNQWMDSYVNLYGQLVTTSAIRDSLLSLAGVRAIEKAKHGNPLVYGWMVDYFYRGYEVNGIDAGIKILEPYLNDPNCLTTKQQEIARRIKGMETLVPGSKAPDISLSDAEGNPFELYTTDPTEKYTLLLFWSADCEHCADMLNNLYPWQQQPELRSKLAVVAISLDETETEINEWNRKIPTLQGWRHILAPEGVRSKVAYDYFVLATPVMVLIDSKTKNIVATPGGLEELKKAVK